MTPDKTSISKQWEHSRVEKWFRHIPKIQQQHFSSATLIVASILILAAIALNAPGQLSYDTVIQLSEAATGKSISWSPPFMSALLRWLGGGEIGTAAIVVINSVSIYLAFWLLTAAIIKAKNMSEAPSINPVRLALCLALLLNPVIFVYVGIVWKDVLFASVLSLATGLSFWAATANARTAILLSLIATILLSAGLLIRQQGIFMAPVLATLPLIAALYGRKWTKGQKALISVSMIALFIASSALINYQVRQAIVESSDKSTTTGFKYVMFFDVSGVIANTDVPIENLQTSISSLQREAIRQKYTFQRIDFLAGDPVVVSWFDSIALRSTWQRIIQTEPKAYMQHKLSAFRALLDVDGLGGCLPIHVGVEGRQDLLNTLGITKGRDSRDDFIYRIASGFFEWPFYRHWFYLLALCIASVMLYYIKMPVRIKPMCAVLSVALWLYYLSYLATGIACDFRYLFSAIPMTSFLWIALLAGGRFTARASPVSHSLNK